MPFTAKYKGNRVDATNFPADVWNELKASTEKHDLYCPNPNCSIQMIPKTYHRTGTQFFAHKHESNCPMSKGMTPEHLMLQNQVQKAVIDAGWQAEKEVYLPELRNELKRYVDVLAVSPDDPDSRIAFEIQWSPQTPEKYIQRTRSYTERGILTYWVSRKQLPLSCLDDGVCNWQLSEDNNTVQYQVASEKTLILPVENFVKKVLSDDGMFVESCGFTDRFHFCEGIECAMEAGKSQHSTRISRANFAMNVLLKYIREWNEAVTSEYLWKVLDHIAEKEELQDVRDVLDNLTNIGFRYIERQPIPYDIEQGIEASTPLGLTKLEEARYSIMKKLKDERKSFFHDSYPPPTLPKLCRWLWNSEKLYKKMVRSPAYDPRLDYDYWQCSCDWKHLEIGYRLFQGNKRTKDKPVRVNVIRCSECGAMHSGAGPSKKRIKQDLLHKAKRYELVSGHLDKKYRAKGKGYRGYEVHPDAPIKAKSTR